MVDFDDILKKGKSAINTIDPRAEWNKRIGGILYELHQLNNLYNDSKTHYVREIKRIKCDKCGVVTFLLTVCDIDDTLKSLDYRLSDWKITKDNIYLCSECQTP